MNRLLSMPHVWKGSCALKSILYLRLKKKVVAEPGQLLRMKDVCRLVSLQNVEHLLEIPVYTATLEHGNFAVVEFIELVALIQQQSPEMDPRLVGPAQMIIEIRTVTRMPKMIAVVLVWALLFVGSGMAIMNFHMDVSMKEVQQQIYYFVTGQHVSRPWLIQIPYSFGIGMGMILFFNHLFKKRFNEEPSPMELEMFSYQETIDQYVINDEKQKAVQRTDENRR
jgi:stage V sporulation protein AA